MKRILVSLIALALLAPLDSDGEPILPALFGTTLTGFQAGEVFKLPGAPYTLTVKSTGETSAVFTLTK